MPSLPPSSMGALDDHYQVLGVQHLRGARALDIGMLREAYKQALLACHPDKQQLPRLGSGESTTAVAASHALTVDDVTLAYKTLADPELRAEYDRLWARQAAGAGRGLGHAGMETVDLSELEEQSAGVWSRTCRCGSSPAFVVTEAELEANVEHGELVTGCKGCSLWLQVLFSAED